jgi:Txe/YoeB family toxin of toxin-antitoxin system
MRIAYSPAFHEGLQWWRERSETMLRRILRLVHAAKLDPMHGFGDPRLVKEMGRGVWGRHITEDHYLIYVLERDALTFLSCRAVRY